jgi:diamine N-acetyltransferase
MDMETTLKPLEFVDISTNPDAFFQFITKEWADSIAPIWDAYKNDANIFALMQNTNILAGGIVFKNISPDVAHYSKDLINLLSNFFSNNYLYIAYLYVSESERGKGLGVLWLNHVFNYFPNVHFMLTVEDENLLPFYKKIGFIVYKIIAFENHNEWLLIR